MCIRISKMIYHIFKTVYLEVMVEFIIAPRLLKRRKVWAKTKNTTLNTAAAVI